MITMRLPQYADIVLHTLSADRCVCLAYKRGCIPGCHIYYQVNINLMLVERETFDVVAMLKTRNFTRYPYTRKVRLYTVYGTVLAQCQ